MQGNPCYARLFADLPYTPQGAFSCPFGTIHLAPPNPIKASGGRSRAPPVARGARRKPSEQGSARKTPRADAARPLRTALRPPNPRGFFDKLKAALPLFLYSPPGLPAPPASRGGGGGRGSRAQTWGASGPPRSACRKTSGEWKIAALLGFNRIWRHVRQIRKKPCVARVSLHSSLAAP